MRRSSLVTGAVLVGLVVLMAVVGAVWTPYDPTAISGARLQPPAWPHVLGTDGLGADIFSRLLHGARLCLLVGVGSVLLAALVGIPLGVLAGMSRGWVGRLVSRGADILLAFPALLLAILFAAALRASVWTATVAIAVATVPAFIRVAQAATLEVMGRDFIIASRLVGTPWWRVAWRHVLPTIAPVLGVQAAVNVGLAILAEAGLSYLGLASGSDTPTWGRMLREAQDQVFTAPLTALWPGLAIALTTIGFNLLADGLRDRLDPRQRELA